MDKVSDYEDVWGPEGNNSCSTFKPLKPENNSENNGLMKSKRPDLLPDTLRKYRSLISSVRFSQHLHNSYKKKLNDCSKT